MRILVPLLLLTATVAVVSVPGASACHIVVDEVAVGDFYVIADIGPNGCPHRLSACVMIWLESNGERGLQTSGQNPDTLIAGSCPLP